MRLRSLTRKLGISPQYFLISISTPHASSSQASLRAISRGACYLQVRIAYYAYSQVTRADRLTSVSDFDPPVGGLHLAQE